MANDRRPTTIACAHCGREVELAKRGRTKVFCSPSCRSMHFVQKNRRGTGLSVEERQRLKLWQMLKDFKLVEGDAPPPKPKADGEAT